MAEDTGNSFWGVVNTFLVSYKWPLVALAVVVAVSRGWVDVPAIDWAVDHTERLIRALIPGGA